jgi:RNA polymerase sigma-70 factor, ECF subfamily
MLNFPDSFSFKAFIKQHQDRVFNTVLKMVQCHEDAEEITQDVFVDIYKNASTFRGDSSITTWLYRIAMNKTVDHLRKKSRWRIFQSSKSESNEARDFYHPGVQSENREKARMLFKALNELPIKQRQAWVLSEMENIGNKEISQIMAVSVSSVESLLFRARQNLRKTLSGFYPGSD